ncbi:MAG: hypothetical protein AUH29_05720 [Candidatus Rokubacteria bacterium 13_1_40CM_69_27]|nr:MAG: hypothetical protein AUH29_05720 [Candidatus Rokubacteria bacterium 13_1_40CM_69_27]OLC30211.1 MAG: hypothetical protein AUH81_20605 [Candidatus Rokubacteria bacterium 13_1_40CM_4_69_5]
MNTRRWVVLILVAMSATACATSRSRPVYGEFEDVPVPTGLVYQPTQSIIIESPSVRAARLVYRGRVDPGSLRLAMRTIMEANGWGHVSTSTTVERGTVQVYEKAGNSLQVAIYEGFWFTYVAVGASRAFPIAQPTAAGPLENSFAATAAGTASESVVETASGAPGQPKPGKSAWEKARDEVKSFFDKLFSN